MGAKRVKIQLDLPAGQWRSLGHFVGTGPMLIDMDNENSNLVL